MRNRWRLSMALCTLAAYLLIVFWDAWVPHAFTGLMAELFSSLSPHLLASAVFLLVVVLAARWGDLGFNRPRPWKSLRLLLPTLPYFMLFLGLALVRGLPPAGAALFAGLNILLAGFAEEVMFRGVLFRALLARVDLWTAVWLTALSFGAVHLLNALTTGDLAMAAAQGLAAVMTGTFLMAVLLRTGSLWPGILFHAAWDFCIGLAAAGSAGPPAEGAAGQPAASVAANLPPWAHVLIVLVPMLLVLPNFLYALFLFRRVKTGGPATTRQG